MSARRRTAVRTVAVGVSVALLAAVAVQASAASASAATGQRATKRAWLGVLGTYAAKPAFFGPVAPAWLSTPAPVAPGATPRASAGPAEALVEAATRTTTVASPKPAVSPVTRPVASPAAVPAPNPAALPAGDLPGWRQVYAEDFTGGSLPSGWGAYEGQPGGEPDGWWSPSHVTVGDGALQLKGYRDGGRWVTGGVMNSKQASTTYGKYEVRFRMTKGNGVKYAILLWPKSENWPIDGEIDFAEDGGGNRTTTSATMHYGANDSIIQRELTGQDFSQWRTVGVEWTPGKLVYTLDGKPWATVASSYVPSGPMDLAIQTETGTCGGKWLGCPDATTPSQVNLEVDWVSVWTRS